MIEMNEKRRFITYEFGLLSLKAALSTRDDKNPIYALGFKQHQRGPAKQAFRSILENIETVYLSGGISGEAHITYIENTANSLSKTIGEYLHNGRFRFGVAQNLPSDISRLDLAQFLLASFANRRSQK